MRTRAEANRLRQVLKEAQQSNQKQEDLPELDPEEAQLVEDALLPELEPEHAVLIEEVPPIPPGGYGGLKWFKEKKS